MLHILASKLILSPEHRGTPNSAHLGRSKLSYSSRLVPQKFSPFSSVFQTPTPPEYPCLPSDTGIQFLASFHPPKPISHTNLLPPLGSVPRFRLSRGRAPSSSNFRKISHRHPLSSPRLPGSPRLPPANLQRCVPPVLGRSPAHFLRASGSGPGPLGSSPEASREPQLVGILPAVGRHWLGGATDARLRPPLGRVALGWPLFRGRGLQGGRGYSAVGSASLDPDVFLAPLSLCRPPYISSRPHGGARPGDTTIPSLAVSQAGQLAKATPSEVLKA